MHNTIISQESNNLKTDFLRTSALRIHIVCLSILLPFTIMHLFAGRYEAFLGNLVIFAISTFNIWSILVKKRYYSRVTLIVLLPVVIISLLLSIRTEGVIGLFSCYAAMISFYFILRERQAWFANVAILAVSVPTAWMTLGSQQTISFAASFLLVSLFTAIFLNVIYSQQRKLQLQAATDTLTGLLNRTILYQSLEQAIAQNKRKGIAMTIITFDIDHFKSINDSYGHDVGDEVLQSLGALLKQKIRRTDKVFRLGGEEFMVILFDTDLEEGYLAAENLREIISSTSFIRQRQHQVTVSLGVATLLPDESLTNWVKRCDEYLYVAKSTGRNKVVYRNSVNGFEPSVDIAVNRLN